MTQARIDRPLYNARGWGLDRHAAVRVGCPAAQLTRKAIDEWQAHALREILSYVKRHSPFYARHLGNARAENLRDIVSLPFMDAGSLRENHLALLCVPQDEIARVATFASSSGTSGTPKRIFFTDEDLENTIDFFANGMRHVPGTRTLICMGEPPATPGSVGALLSEALSRIGRVGFVEGFVSDPEKTMNSIQNTGADSLVGVPSQMLALARYPEAQKTIRLQGILLSGDYASDGLTQALEDSFDCAVFRHFGMAETGYGAAVECARHSGLHIREADLLFEIVKPGGEKTLPDGEWGEVAVTTLTRRAMPLIRFRTGDLGRILSGACSCGSVLKRMEMLGRLDNVLALPAGPVYLHELDDALQPLIWLSDYDAHVEYGTTLFLSLTLYCAEPLPGDWLAESRKAIETIAPLRDALSSETLRVSFALSQRPISPYAGKKILRPM